MFYRWFDYIFIRSYQKQFIGFDIHNNFCGIEPPHSVAGALAFCRMNFPL